MMPCICSFDLPIFGLDLVLVKGRVSLAVCDLMSLRPDRRLPAHYMEVRGGHWLGEVRGGWKVGADRGAAPPPLPHPLHNQVPPVAPLPQPMRPTAESVSPPAATPNPAQSYRLPLTSTLVPTLCPPQTMAMLQHTFFEGCDMSDRRVPDWGKAIFSPLALCITPKTPEELAGFVKWVPCV